MESTVDLEADWEAPKFAWMDQPRPCLDKLDLFFPEKKEVKKIEQAMELCLSCTFRKECEEFRQISGSKFGIWAGKFYAEESDGT